MLLAPILAAQSRAVSLPPAIHVVGPGWAGGGGATTRGPPGHRPLTHGQPLWVLCKSNLSKAIVRQQP